MKQKTYLTQTRKKDNNIIINVDYAHLPSKTHKYGALNNKSQYFEDKRKKPPKYKHVYEY